MDDVTEPDAPATAGAFDRRSALLGSFALAAFAACRAAEGPTQEPAPKEPQKDAPSKGAEAFLPVMVAIADRLLPADASGPGAKDVDVAAFFDKVMKDDRLGTIHPLLKRGCAFLMKAAHAEANAGFAALDAAAQDDLLLRLSENKMRPDGFQGPTFVRVMLALTLEGYLGDPRHGGNKGGLGWRTLGFSPEGRAQGLALKVLP